jgi:CBS domain-containing protein
MEPPVPESAGQRPTAHIVADVMRQAATTVETQGHLAAAAYLMNHADQSALVVVDGADRPIALITEADLLRAVAHGADTGRERISDWMNREPPTVSADTVVMAAMQVMVATGERHLPVVSDGRLVGIVAASDLMAAVVHSVRLCAAVVFVSDLARSLSFYQPLLRYPITVGDADAALLTGPNGSQLYLRQAGDRSMLRDGFGVQWVGWTAGDAHDLDRCSEVLKERGAYVGRDTSEGITLLEGRDPDGLPVIIVYPGAEHAPRHVIHDRIRRA